MSKNIIQQKKNVPVHQHHLFLEQTHLHSKNIR